MSLESFNAPLTEESNVERTEGRLKRYFNRHISFLALSLFLSTVPDKEAQALELDTGPAIFEQDKSLDEVDKQRRADFLKLREIIETEKIDEKVAKLRELFGSALDNFFSMRHIEGDLDLLKKLKERQAEEGVFVNKGGLNFMTLGGIVSQAFNERWTHRELDVKPTELTNIESVQGLGADTLKFILDQTYPQGFIDKHVSEIKYTGEVVPSGANTIIAGQVETISLANLGRIMSSDGRAPIVVNPDSDKGVSGEYFLDVLEHEIGHTTDWAQDPSLTSAERVSLLLDVSERIDAPDRFMSGYVEGITLDTISPHVDGGIKDPTQKEKYLKFVKTTEYWPEIVKQFFKAPIQLEKDHPADYELVKKWVIDLKH